MNSLDDIYYMFDLNLDRFFTFLVLWQKCHTYINASTHFWMSAHLEGSLIFVPLNLDKIKVNLLFSH